MVYDGFCCHFLSTCEIDCQGDLVIYFTMLMPIWELLHVLKLIDTTLILTLIGNSQCCNKIGHLNLGSNFESRLFSGKSIN
jgi:hypothetical protein